MDGYNQSSYQADRVEFGWRLNGNGAYINKNINITLPNGVDAKNIKWLSVWDDDIKISFGDLVFNSTQISENACASN